MRITFFTLLFAIILCSKAQVKNPFLSLKFDKVILYDCEPPVEDPELLNPKGEIRPSVKIKKQVKADVATIATLNKKLGQKSSYGDVTAACFEPHLAIVYYLNGKIVRHVLVCMGCNVLSADIDIPAQHQNRQGQGANAYYLGEGMSTGFRRYLNGLLKKYDFSHQGI